MLNVLDATEDFIAERYEYNQDLRKYYQSEAKDWESETPTCEGSLLASRT